VEAEAAVEEAGAGSLPLEERVQRLDPRQDRLPGPPLARAPAAKPHRDRLRLDLQQVDRLVRKRALGPAARATSPAPDNGRPAVPQRPIDLPRADQRRVS
jgi:hypothetical protein